MFKTAVSLSGASLFLAATIAYADSFQVKFATSISQVIQWGQYIGDFKNECPNSEAEAACAAAGAELPDYYDFQDLIKSFDHTPGSGGLYLTPKGKQEVANAFGDMDRGVDGYFWGQTKCSPDNSAISFSAIGSGYTWPYRRDTVLAVRCVRRLPEMPILGGFITKYKTSKGTEWSQTIGNYSNGCVRGTCDKAPSLASKACQTIGGRLPANEDFEDLYKDFGATPSKEWNYQATFLPKEKFGAFKDAFDGDWSFEDLYWTSTVYSDQTQHEAHFSHNGAVGYGRPFNRLRYRETKLPVKCVKP